MTKKEGETESRIISAILQTFEKEKINSRKSVDTMIKERDSPPNYVERELYPFVADKLVKMKYLFRNNGTVLVFSRDKQQNYFWQPATATDRIISYFNANLEKILSRL